MEKDNLYESMAALQKEGHSTRKIADALGVTRYHVLSTLKNNGVKCKSGRKAKSDSIIYDGKKYSWSNKGFWRCTEYKDRHNLTRKIWEDNFGKIPKGFIVFYKDGNRNNISIDNLGCLSRKEIILERLKNPFQKDMLYAYGCYARLQRIINDKLDPMNAKERGRKAWQTRLLKGTTKESIEKGVRTRRELYGPKGHRSKKD